MSKTLADCAKIIDCLHATPSYCTDGFPMVRVENVNNNFLNLQECLKVDEATCDLHNKNHVPQINDIIITRVGSYGMISLVNTNEKFCLGQNIAIISPYKNGRFYYYYLLSPYIQKIIYGNSGGSSYKSLSLEQIRKLPVNIENLNLAKIENALYAIDSKIDNNNAIISELQAMAKTLYDYWFLQFDFPDENGKPYKSSGGKMVWNEELKREIPEGWEVKSLDFLGEIVAGGTPSTSNPDYYCENGIGWITPKDLADSNRKYISHGERDITELGLKESSAILMPEGSVLMTSRAPIGYLAIATESLTTNQGFKSIVPKAKYGSEFVYQTLYAMMPYIKTFGSGSTFAEISKSMVAELKVIVPSDKVVKLFQERVESTCKKIELCETENQELASLRDFLLPMLMNGQVTFKEE